MNQFLKKSKERIEKIQKQTADELYNIYQEEIKKYEEFAPIEKRMIEYLSSLNLDIDLIKEYIELERKLYCNLTLTKSEKREIQKQIKKIRKKYKLNGL